MKRALIGFLTWGMFILPAGAAAAGLPEEIVRQEMQYLSKGDKVAYSRLWMRNMQSEVLFVHSPRQKRTVYNIQSAALVDTKELPPSLAANCMPKLSRYLSHFGPQAVKVLYVAADYRVREENYFQLNGMNYVLQVFVKERGTWRIAESVVAPTDRIIAYGYGFNTEEEQTYLERREALR